ncbi:hypothetical protein D6T65_12855 [Arthrobacter frigidicola]|nr:hypothetical protein D6T65_12855 [Arthrobacter frigidicola]
MGGRLLSRVDVADIGRAVFSIFAAGGEYIGKTVSLAGDHLTGRERAGAEGRIASRRRQWAVRGITQEGWCLSSGSLDFADAGLSPGAIRLNKPSK